VEQRVELAEAQRQLLLATQRRTAAVEAWALALSRGQGGTAQLEELARRKDEAQAEVARWGALIDLAGV